MQLEFQHINLEADKLQTRLALSKTILTINEFIELQIENSFYAPREDHTYQDSNGHYLLFQNTTNDKDFWIITNQTFIYTQNHCLMFWYYYDGEVTNWIRYKSYFSSDYTLFGEFGTTIETRTWNLIKLDIPFNTNYNNTRESVLVRDFNEVLIF